MTQGLDYQLEIGASLSDLRDRGVLILGSGNVVHILRRMQFDGAPQDFAIEFDTLFADRLSARNFDALGSLLEMAHPSVAHYLPALTIAGASHKNDALTVMTDSIDLGSVSIRSFVFHA